MTSQFEAVLRAVTQVPQDTNAIAATAGVTRRCARLHLIMLLAQGRVTEQAVHRRPNRAGRPALLYSRPDAPLRSRHAAGGQA